MANKPEAPIVNEYETIYVPRTSREDDRMYVAVNGERIMVRKGETVTVKRKFAEAIRNSLEQDRATEELIDSISVK